MSVNQISLPVSRRKILAGSFLAGIFALLGAPMLLVQFLSSQREFSSASSGVAVLGVFYIGGWIVGAIEMFRQKVYGDDQKRGVIFGVQIVLLALALTFSTFDTLGFNEQNLGVLFLFADLGYPFSHLFMIVVGVFVWRARRWQGIYRLAPLIVGFSLPASLLVLMPLFGEQTGAILFASTNAAGLGLIGLGLCKGAQPRTDRAENRPRTNMREHK